MYRRVISVAALSAMISGLLLATPAATQDAAKPAANSSDQSQNTASTPKPASDAKPGPDPVLSPTPAPAEPKKGAVAPDFTLKDMQGNNVHLSSLKGKAVVLSFWATWCEPCKIEMPWLVDLQKKYGPQGLQVLGVAMDDAEDQEIRDFAKKMGVNYPVLKGTEALADLYGGLDGLPSTFFVDRSGKISDRAVGLVSQSEIEESIKRALAQIQAPAIGEKQP